MIRPFVRAAQSCWSCSSKLLPRSPASVPHTILNSSASTRIHLHAQGGSIRHIIPTSRAYSGLDKPSKSAEDQETREHNHEQEPEPPPVDESESARTELATPGSKTTPSTSDLPWYLEVEAPRHPTLIPQQHPLPEVPTDSPKLLKPLVEFVSDELGIDRLTLLDLRELDPPPALGPNLLMLFGSARMERHLHVSADRLVRWLASHGITATADGLMTRNELKLKMRRAARKAKTMAVAGGNTSENQSLATSWICVNLGTIGWQGEEEEITDAEGKVMGFGRQQTGSTVVVQLFTDAKRQELDLETLWGRQLEKSQNRAREIAGLPKPPKPVDPFMEAFGDSAKPNRKSRRARIQKSGF